MSRDSARAPCDDLLRRTELELNALLNVTRALTASQSVDTIVEAVTRSLVLAIGPPDACILFLFDDHEGLLVPRSSLGYDMGVLGSMRLAPGESMAGKAFSAGEAALYRTEEEVEHATRDLSLHNRAAFESALGGRGRVRSAVAVPIRSGDRILGSLVLHDLHSSHRFGEKDLRFATTLAGLIGLSVERSRMAEEGEKARVAEEANTLRMELLATLSHQMRTPLTSIKGYTTALLRTDVQWDDSTRREFLEIISEECDNLLEIISDLLESSAIEAGAMKIQSEPVLLSMVAKGAVEEVSHRTRRHKFMVSIPSSLPYVMADPKRLGQVFHNLLDNSVKYSPDGGLIVIRAEKRPGEVLVSVADQGIGIAPEHLNRLFEKFFRIEGAGRVAGTGLGLPIAHKIVEAHGGRIWAESGVGKGTTLYFTLPAASPSAAPEADGGQHPARVARTAGEQA